MSYALGTATGKIVLDYDGSGVDQAKKGFDSLQQKSDNTNAALKKVSNIAGGAGIAIAGGLGVAINAAADFEQRMSAISAVSGASQQEMDKVRSKALQLGKDTAFSASEAGSAIEELVKAGISIPDVMNGAADATVALAAAGEVALPEAATIASNAMNQFGLKAQDMPKIADQIAGAANASAIDVSDFGYSLSQAGAVAHLAGVDFQDTATAIALMGNAGIKGSDAGTSLKSMLMRLQPTTKKQFDTMTDLGLITFSNSNAMKALRDNGVKPLGDSQGVLNKQLQELAARLSGAKVGSADQQKEFLKLATQTGALHNKFYTLNGDTKSLASISDSLKNALKGMSEQQKQATLTTLFGSDAIRGAAILADNGAKGFNKMAASMDKVKAADVAKTRMDNLKGSIEQMKGSLETAGIAVGTMLLPPLRALVDMVTSALNHFLQLSDGTQRVILIVIAAVGAILLIIAVVGRMIIFINETRAAMLALRTAMAETWLAALGPIALIIVAIAAVVAIIVILWKHSETFRNIVTGAWNAVKAAAVAVWNWFKGLPGMFVGVWNAIVNGIKSFIGGAINWLRSNWMLLLPIFLGPLGLVIALVVKFWAQIKGFFQAGVNLLLGIWRGFWNIFGGVITAAFRLIAALVLLGWTIIKGIFILELQILRRVFSTIWNAIVGVLRAVWRVIASVIKAGLSLVRALLTREWNGIKNITRAVWGAIKAVISAVWGFIGPYIKGAVRVVLAAITGAWNAVKSVTSRVWNSVVDVIKNVIGNIKDAVGNIKDAVTGALSGAGQWLYNSGKELIQGLLNGIESMISSVTNKIRDITNKIKSFLPGSPVKEGPLVSWNNGGAGKRLMRLLADGIDSERMNVAASVINVTDTVSKSMQGYDPSMVASVVPAPTISRPNVGVRPTSEKARRKDLVMVSGTLRMDGDGSRVYIEGIAEEVVASNDNHHAAGGRRNGR